MTTAWSRRPKESSPAWEAFTTYLMLGPSRTLAKTGNILGKSAKLMEDWSVKHDWGLRVAAYEEHFQLEQLDRQEEQRRKLMAEHLELGTTLLRKSLVRLRALADEFPSDPQEAARLKRAGRLPTIDQAIKAGEVGVKITRLAVGLDGKAATEDPDRDPIDLTGWDPERLAKLEEVLGDG